MPPVKLRDAPTRVIPGDGGRTVPIVAAGLPTAKLVKRGSPVRRERAPRCVPRARAEKVNAELLSFLSTR